jgi:nucleoside-diphosphate-sugar epimerase
VEASNQFTLIDCDLVSTDLDVILGEVAGVFHLAGQPGVRNSWEDFDSYLYRNVTATQRLMEAVGRRRVPLVYASSSSVYGDATRMPVREDDPTRPISPYGVTKLAGEHIAELYGAARGIPVVSLRYFTVYGPRQRPDMAFSRFIDAALTGRPISVLGDGRQTRDFTYVGDAVDATLRAMSAAAGTYNVGGGYRASINEVLAILAELSSVPLAVRRDHRVAGDARHTWADTSRARAYLGWRPQTSLRDGLLAQYCWMCEATSADLVGSGLSG